MLQVNLKKERSFIYETKPKIMEDPFDDRGIYLLYGYYSFYLDWENT